VKGLFVDLSEFSVLAARTSGFGQPMVIEELAEKELGDSPDELASFIDGFVEANVKGYAIARCAVYPNNRFARFYEAESTAKLRDPQFLNEVADSYLAIDLAKNLVSILDARDGSEFVPGSSNAKKLLFCGAPAEEFQYKQDELLDLGLYPDRLELSTLTTLGGISDYTRFNEIKAPVLCFELGGDSANVFIVNEGRVEVARPVPFGLGSIYPLLQKELGLKDEKSARKLFYSNTFDFAEMGPKLLRRMIKELQASTGFYEVQTGQSIEKLFVSVLPKNLAWITRIVAESLGVEILQPSYGPWLESLNIEAGDNVELSGLGSRWFSLFSLMGDYHLRETSEESEKE
jgi:hypothetical protein